MNAPVCEQIGVWLRDAEPGATPTGEMAAHIAGCARCRGLLALLLAVHSNTPTPPDTVCIASQDDIAAYVDLERSAGPALAAQTYPLVWWQLWICPDCAEDYRLIGVLADQAAAGDLAELSLTVPVSQPRRPQRRLPQLHLQRAFLAHVFATHTLAGVGWSADAGGMVLAEGEESGYVISLSMQQRGDTECVITVTVEPPISGYLALRFGELLFRAPFDLQGIARVTSLPLSLLAAADGPEMTVSIEPESDGDTVADSPP